MRHLKYIFLFLTTILFSQTTIKTNFLKKIAIENDYLIHIDNFSNQYFISANTLIKKTKKAEFIYNNMMLGTINSVEVFSPLKINLFYKEFNMVIILDNRLSEVTKINFNTLRPFRNISNISIGNDNTIWCFNQDNQQLELFDYRTNTTRLKTLPIKENIVSITSNYNTCWLLTKTNLYIYNYFGSLIAKLKNEGFTMIKETNGNIILQKMNSLYFLKKNGDQIIPIELPNLLIKQFFVTNETLYIYDDEFLHQYQLIKK